MKFAIFRYCFVVKCVMWYLDDFHLRTYTQLFELAINFENIGKIEKKGFLLNRFNLDQDVSITQFTNFNIYAWGNITPRDQSSRLGARFTPWGKLMLWKIVLKAFLSPDCKTCGGRSWRCSAPPSPWVPSCRDGRWARSRSWGRRSSRPGVDSMKLFRPKFTDKTYFVQIYVL
jgi:hypothetical protein